MNVSTFSSRFRQRRQILAQIEENERFFSALQQSAANALVAYAAERPVVPIAIFDENPRPVTHYVFRVESSEDPVNL